MDTTTCLSDGSWTGSDDVCRRGEFLVPKYNIPNSSLIVMVRMHMYYIVENHKGVGVCHEIPSHKN